MSQKDSFIIPLTMISGKPHTSRDVRAVWEGVEASPLPQRISRSLPHDTLLFLGGKEKTTLKEMEELLGKETIDTYNTGESRGREISHSLNYQKLGKSLMSIDELAVMDGGKCILQLRGVRPFLSDKYDITSHPNYKYLSDSNKRNAFDIEKYLSRQLKLRLEEEYEAFEISISDNSRDDEALLEEWTDTTQLQAAGYGGLL